MYVLDTASGVWANLTGSVGGDAPPSARYGLGFVPAGGALYLIGGSSNGERVHAAL